jgi:hypothetical protein
VNELLKNGLKQSNSENKTKQPLLDKSLYGADSVKYPYWFQEFKLLENPVCVFNEESEILFTNDAFIELFDNELTGWMSSEIIRRYESIRKLNYYFLDLDSDEPLFQSYLQVDVNSSVAIPSYMSCFLLRQFPKVIFITVLYTSGKGSLNMFYKQLRSVKGNIRNQYSEESFCSENLNKINALLPVKIGMVHYYNRKRDELILLNWRGVLHEAVLPLMKLFEEDLYLRSVKNMVPGFRDCILSDPADSPVGSYFMEQQTGSGLQKMLSLPLVFRNELQGVITLLSDKRLPENSGLISQIVSFANNLAFIFYECKLLNNIFEQNYVLAQKRKSIGIENKHKINYVQKIFGDLNNGLRSISGSSTILSSNLYKPADGDKQTLIKDISQGSQKLITLVNHIQNIVPLSEYSEEIENVPIHINEFLEEIVGSVEPILETKSLVINLDNQLTDQWLYTDPSRLRNIIKILLTDAVKHSTYSVAINLQSVNNVENYCCNIMSNDGLKSDAIRYSALYEMNESGYCLTFARKLASEIHGSIDVRKVDNGLTIYTLVVDKKSVSNKIMADLQSNSEKLGEPEVEKRLCVIIGDNGYSNKWLENVLARKGYSAYTIDNAMRLPMLKNLEGYRLIIFNITSDSKIFTEYLEYTREFLELKTKSLIVVSRLDERLNAFRLGAVDYFQKPYELNFFLDRVCKIINSKNGTS